MHIVPQRLRRLRKERGLSREVLASRSHVSPKQIQRLEDPKHASANVRPNTLHRLARALDVRPEELTGEPPAPENPKTLRIGAALSPGVRLAYELIERRYGVGVGHILNMAPLYFALLAEGSLSWRRAELEELRDAISRVDQLGDHARKRFARHAFWAQEDSFDEEAAIARGDLFNDPLPSDYRYDPDENWDGSPFADYLRKLADDLGKPELVDLDPYSHGRVAALPGVPGYRIYTEDLLKVAPLESDAMYALHAGDAGLSDIPDALMADGAGAHRHEWLEARLSEPSKQWLDLVRELRVSIQLPVGDEPGTASPPGDDR